ncbi:hypothetical protein SISSUDRAFT_1078616 [Sistotremastrum suecicum HHB10207 ss-3]|uniref:G-patch domain-containing protein n=1 Tax=Sistotremastrum suecicum HHB10207 ss-3 TaxID=1314776 RepID=A0A166GWX7_9AGAM|nr:hypothetical protein SISSUDRAFT_1078616 [Sistotremastrum suecicum HHB10207 ss-3]
MSPTYIYVQEYDSRVNLQYERPQAHYNNPPQDGSDHGFDPRGNQPRRRLVPSETSRHIIFLGLDPDFTEGDIAEQALCNLHFSNLLSDRRCTASGLSKGFGFAQFTSMEQAESFLRPNFPFINVPPPASHGASAAAAFKLALDTGAPHQGRRVKIDFSQSAHPPERGRGMGPRQPNNDGTRDIGNSQATVLLLRGLDPMSTPASIALALRSAAGPGVDPTKGLKRVILITDRATGASWGYAFLELVNQTHASTLLGYLISPQLHPSGFRINDRPIAASFAHPYSFQPLQENEIRDEACVLSSNNIGGVEGVWAKYWDENSAVAEMTFDVQEEEEPESQPVKEKKKKEKKAGDAEVSAFLGGITEDQNQESGPSTLPVSDKPVTLSFSKGAAMARPPVSGLVLGADDADEEALAGEPGSSAGASNEPSKAFAFKKVAPLIASKKVVNSINKWNTVQEELRDGSAPKPLDETVQKAAPEKAEKSKGISPTIEVEFEFSNTQTLACYLCSRQFKSVELLKRHSIESDLHKKNLKDSALRDLAREKASGVRAKQEQDGKPKYRDRALERRALHSQPDVPILEETTSGRNKRKAEGPPPAPPPPPPPVAPAKDETNIGNKLLQKMGWTLGTGLGTEGEGRVDPIQTAMYAQGAGLGASKGTEVGKYADGYAGYVHKARDAVSHGILLLSFN